MIITTGCLLLVCGVGASHDAQDYLVYQRHDEVLLRPQIFEIALTSTLSAFKKLSPSDREKKNYKNTANIAGYDLMRVNSAQRHSQHYSQIP